MFEAIRACLLHLGAELPRVGNIMRKLSMHPNKPSAPSSMPVHLLLATAMPPCFICSLSPGRRAAA